MIFYIQRDKKGVREEKINQQLKNTDKEKTCLQICIYENNVNKFLSCKFKHISTDRN